MKSLKFFLACGFFALGMFARGTGAQQQFGPPPQSLYHQNPGDAPTFVHYGSARTPAKSSGVTVRARATVGSGSLRQMSQRAPSVRRRTAKRSIGTLRTK